MIYLNCKTTKLALEVAFEVAITTRAIVLEEVATEAIDEMEEVVEVEIIGEIQEVIVTTIDGETSPVIHGEMVGEVINQAGAQEEAITASRILDGRLVVVIVAAVVEGLTKITPLMEVSIYIFYILIFRGNALYWQLTIQCYLREPQ